MKLNSEFIKNFRPKFLQEINFKSYLQLFRNKFLTFVSELTAKLQGDGGGSGKKSVSSKKQFDWNLFVQTFFSPKARPQINNFFIFVFVISLAYVAGKMVAITTSAFLHRPPQMSKNLPGGVAGPNTRVTQDIDAIKLANAFRTKSNSTDAPSDRGNKLDPGEFVKPKKNIICDLDNAENRSSVGVKLTGTTVMQNNTKSVATIQIGGGSNVVFLREKDSINSGFRLEIIAENKIIVKNLEEGTCEYVLNDEIKNNDRIATKNSYKVLSPQEGKKIIPSKLDQGIKNEGNAFVINKKFRDEMLTDMSTVLTQARAVTIKNPDGSLSFKMMDVVPGSIYTKLNIQNGDYINTIDGKKIQNINEIMATFGRFKDLDNLQLGISRDGVDQTYEYTFE